MKGSSYSLAVKQASRPAPPLCGPVRTLEALKRGRGHPPAQKQGFIFTGARLCGSIIFERHGAAAFQSAAPFWFFMEV